MKERPILFSGPMVRAILDGKKTQTRRIVKHQGDVVPTSREVVTDLYPSGALGWFALWPHKAGTRRALTCQYGGAGDRLWVREEWAAHWMYNDVPPRDARSTHPGDNYWYRIDGDDAVGSHGCPAQGRRGKWRVGRFMPRWASRITLAITAVRVERLHDISAADAVAEGVIGPAHGWDGNPTYPRARFCTLWKQINGEASWGSNPWVWVIEFNRVQPESEQRVRRVA